MTFDQEVEAKVKAAGLSVTETILLGVAVGLTRDDPCELFEALLDRRLTHDERSALEVIEDEQHHRVENIIGAPVEAETA